MARYTSYVADTLGGPDMAAGSITATTATKIVFKVGDYKLLFIGTFTYDGAGNPSGPVSALRTSLNGVLLEKVITIDKGIAELLSTANAGGYDAMKAFMFTGNDVLIGNNTANSLNGFSGNDSITGGNGADILNGGEGNDTLYGGKGTDLLIGGKGADTLYGNAHADRLEGWAGSDVLYGGGDADILIGGKANDKLYGGAGDDYLLGGGADNGVAAAGNDILRGGTGNDTFVFIANGGGAQVIKDFTDGEDVLYLANYGITSAMQARSFATMVDGNTVFDFGNGHTITVENFEKSLFRVDDFTFSTLEDVVII